MEDPKDSKEEENESATPCSNIEENHMELERNENSPERPQDLYSQNFEVSHSAKDGAHFEDRNFHSADNVLGVEHHSSAHDTYLTMSEEMLNSEAMLAASSDIQDDESVIICKYTQCDFKTSDPEAFLKHEDTHVNADGKSYQCDICHMKFTLFANMRRHKLSHLGVRPFECRLCTKRFFRKDHLMEHLVRQHSKQRPYRCPFCVKSFNFRPHLKVHLSSEHSGIAHDKTCSVCGFKSASSNSAKLHFSICHLKQSPDMSELNPSQSGHNYVHLAQDHQGASENEAIDLGAISQNFSFIPSHYSPFAYVGTESNASIAGPSNLGHSIPRVAQASTPVIAIAPSEVSREGRVRGTTEHVDPSHSSSIASSTTAASPTMCRSIVASMVNSSEYHIEPLTRVIIKPEPPEVVIEDSQNSNVQPTSTMDLTTNIVETTCGMNDAHHLCSSNASLSRKFKHSSGDEGGSERNISPREENAVDSQDARLWAINPSNSSSRSKCCRSRCKEVKHRSSSLCCKHSCSLHSNNCNKKERSQTSQACNKRLKITGSNSDDTSSERKLFSFRESSQISSHNVVSNENNLQRRSNIPCRHNGTVPRSSKSQVGESFNDDKSAVMFNKFEQSTLMCPYCEIVFPDQTLYFLHRSLHTEASPWKCNLCGRHFKDKYDFNSHIISQSHH